MSESAARLSIGESSRVTWLSAKALRLDERRGLLRPDTVDEYTGYRYYRAPQADRARTIALLRRAGMPLERIGPVLYAEAEADERRRLLTGPPPTRCRAARFPRSRSCPGRSGPRRPV